MYIVLGQDKNCQANYDMKVVVRCAMAAEEGRKFEEMNKGTNSHLYKVENEKGQSHFLMRVLEMTTLQVCRCFIA